MVVDVSATATARVRELSRGSRCKNDRIDAAATACVAAGQGEGWPVGPRPAPPPTQRPQCCGIPARTLSDRVRVRSVQRDDTRRLDQQLTLSIVQVRLPDSAGRAYRDRGITAGGS